MEAHDGRLYVRREDGGWTDIGPVFSSWTFDSATSAMTGDEFDGPALTGTATGVIHDDFWQKLCRLLGHQDGLGRLRKRKHGGGLPSYRDVRAHRRTVKYGS